MIRHRFSAEDFHRMAEAGILGEDHRVELIREEVVELSVQNPLVLFPDTEVSPDLALFKPPRTRSRDRLPEAKDALLVGEVAETSLDHGLKVKLPLYARAGIPEVFGVDLVREKVHVFRKPQGEGYGELSVLGLKVPVKEVLP